MAFTPLVPVDPPTPRRVRYGLLAAALGPFELPEGARGGGIIYEPVGCGGAHVLPIDCDPVARDIDPADPLVEAEAFLVYATYECGAAGTSPDRMEEKVRQRLANGEQTSAEAGLALALEAAAETVIPGDPDNFRAVIGELEQTLYGIDGFNYGNQGYLHVPVRYATLAAFSGAVVADGPLYRTQLGTVWVFGAGYPDDGRIWITGTTTVWRANDITVPPARQLFDREHNQYRMLAEREYAVAYDCVAAVADYTGDAAAS